MNELNVIFKEIKTSYDAKCTQTEGYIREIDTIKSTLQMKNDQLEEKNDQLNKKGAQIEALIKTLEEKNNIIASKIDKSTIIVKENTIAEQSKQIK
jgi:FtsZ-binding cell division protein ZapB